MRELVGENAANLVQGEVSQQALGHRDRGVALGAPRGERVRRLPRHHVQTRHLDPRARGELGDRVMDFGRIAASQWTGAGRAQRDPVGIEVAHEVQRDREGDEQPQEGAADQRSDRDHQARQAGDERPGAQPRCPLGG